MRADELDFELPPELIAQEPAADRAASRLLHYRSSDQTATHRRFTDLPTLLKKSDLLVFNNTRVLPARFGLRKSTGGFIEGLFLLEISSGHWRVLLKNIGPVREPIVLWFLKDSSVSMTVHSKTAQGEYEVFISSDLPAATLLEKIGRMPLPPYIRRGRESDDRDDLDLQRYQTVFSEKIPAGSVAAPTAGLHFNKGSMQQLEAAGIQIAYITLNVGMGTFKPVSTETLEEHVMHSESYSISGETADALNDARRNGRRIVSVGTTVTRVLESQPTEMPFVAKEGQTNIFIYPPYQWKHIGAMITNFHLPRSTLIALVAARIGMNEQRRLYKLAIENQYRFFSYGDAMLLE